MGGGAAALYQRTFFNGEIERKSQQLRDNVLARSGGTLIESAPPSFVYLNVRRVSWILGSKTKDQRKRGNVVKLRGTINERGTISVEGALPFGECV